MEKSTIISPIPDLINDYSELAEDFRNKKVALFIGAGVSRLVGCLGWDSLARKLVDKCYKLGFIKFKEKEALDKDYNQKKVITICHHIFNENNHKNEFFKIMKDSLKGDDNLETSSIYDELFSFYCLNITTNADKKLHKYYIEQNRVFNDFSTNIDNKKLYQIHGMIENEDSLVFTVEKYIERYNDDNFIKFIKKIFEDYTVLFLGYGLAEFEILDYVISKINEKGMRIKAYNLMGFFSHEENILSYEKAYFQNMGIGVIPFQKDEKGYDQLFYVIQEWKNKINALAGNTYDIYSRIDIILENYQEKNTTELEQYILEKRFENYFLRRLENIKDNKEWLYFLEAKGYFTYEHLPHKVIVSKDGAYRCDDWIPLRIIAENLKKDIKYCDDIISKVVPNLLENIKKQESKYENYRVHASLLEIIFLSNLKIENEVLSYLEYWLDINENFHSGGYFFQDILNVLLERGNKYKINYFIQFLMNYISKENIQKEFQYIFEKIIETKSKNIAEFVEFSIVETIINFIEKNNHSFSEYKIKAIELNEFDHYYDYEPCIIILLRDILEYNISYINLVIQDFLNKESIFKRLAIHLINYKFNDYRGLFFDKKINFLQDNSLWHEVYMLISNHQMDLESNEIETYDLWVEQIENEMRNGGYSEYIDHSKKRFYYPLRNIKKDDYEKIGVEEPPFKEYLFSFDSKWEEVRYNSPKEKEFFLKESVEEIIKYLCSKDALENVKGIGGTLETSIEFLPNFLDFLDKFIDIPIEFMSYIIGGVTKIYSNEKFSKIEKLLFLIKKTIEKKEFWDAFKLEKNYGNCRDFLFSVTYLFDCILYKNYNKKYNRYLDELEQIFSSIFENLENDLHIGEGVVSHYLNSLNGRFLSNMIELCISLGKIPDIFKNICVKKILEKDFSINYCFGRYYYDIKKYDEDLVNLFRNSINFANNDFVIFMETLVTFYNRLSKEYYYDFREYYAEYLKLEVEKVDKKMCDSISSHIFIFYAYFEELNLINIVLDKKDSKQISNIIRNASREDIEISQEKLLKLWNKIYETIKDIPDNSKLRGSLFMFLKKIDDFSIFSTENLLLMDSIENRDRYSEYETIKTLTSILNKDKHKCAEIFILVLKNGIYPQYLSEDIINILEVLYEEGFTIEADEIACHYANKGYLFLKEIYNKYKNKKF